MDSSLAIALINTDLNEQNALLATYTASAAQAQKRIDALTTALSLLTDGYKTDQTRIDTEVQAGKDAVAAQIVDLQTQVETLNEQILALTPVATPVDTPADMVTP